MSRKKSTLISLGISTALLAVGIWFLFNHFRFFSNSELGWIPGHHMGMGRGMMGGYMMIFWLLIVGAVALLLSGAFARSGPAAENRSDSDAAIQILKQRFARGEIDKTEFEDKLSTLRY